MNRVPQSFRFSAAFALALCLILSPPAVAQSAPAAPDLDTANAAEAPAMTGNTVGWLELAGEVRDAPVPYAWVGEEDADQTLEGILKQLATVTAGKQYMGVVIYFDQPSLSLTQVDAIRNAIAEARAAGRKVIAFAEAYDTRTYSLACAADMIVLQERGSVDLMGMSIEEMYLAGLLGKIGVEADFMQVGQYKGAAEALTNTEPSEQWNQNIDALLTDLYDQVIDQIVKGRSMTKTEVEAIIRDSWSMTDEDYVKRRVVDQVASRDLIDVTGVEFGDAFVWDDTMGLTSQGVMADGGNPFAMFSMLFQPQQQMTTRPTIALIHANGPITSGESSYGDGLFGSESIGSRTFKDILAEAIDDGNIKGAVIRIDSPGGSALASEVIWQAVREFAEQKPIVVSIGGMAASGGYYIASGGDMIYVSPQSIVGSIGVVSGKLVLGGLYDKIGINVVRRNKGPLADMFNSVEPFDAEERDAMQAGLDKVYDQFTERVVIGRGKRLPDINAVAEGRLFTGQQAVANGMADKIGNVDDAITDLAAQLNLPEGGYDVLDLPRPQDFMQFLSQMFSARSAGASPIDPGSQAILNTGRQLLGPRAWRQVSHHLGGLMLLRDEPILTIMPTAIVVK